MPPQPSIEDRVKEQVVRYSYDGLSQREARDLVDKIALHWGLDHCTWLPSSVRPQGNPEVWPSSILVELSHLAPLTTHTTRKPTVLAIIEHVQESRLAGHTRTTGEKIGLEPNDVMVVRIKMQFVADIKKYWGTESQDWMCRMRRNCTNLLCLDGKALCALSLLAQISSVGCVNRLDEVKRMVSGIARERPGYGGRSNHVNLFQALEYAERLWLKDEHINRGFYHKLPHRRSSLENVIQKIMENAAWQRGSAYGTSEFGATIMVATHAGSGYSIKITKGGYWNLLSQRASTPMVAVWTDGKTAANLELIQQLEERYNQPLSMIFDTPDLQVREALAIPTALLRKIVTLAREFALTLYQLQDRLRRKWLEKEGMRFEATDPHPRSLKVSDVEEIIQETLRASRPPSPCYEHLFEESATKDREDEGEQSAAEEDVLEDREEATERENGAVQAEKVEEDRLHKRLRLSNDNWSQTSGHKGSAGDGYADNEVDENAAGLDGGSEVTLKGDASPREIAKETEEEPTQAISDTPTPLGAGLQVVRLPGKFDGVDASHSAAAVTQKERNLGDSDLTFANELQRQLDNVENLVLETRKTLRQYEQRREDLKRQLKQHQQK